MLNESHKEIAFIVDYALVVPLLIVGMILSLWILVAMAIGRNHFSDRLSHCLWFLTLGYFLWIASVAAHFPVATLFDLTVSSWPLRITVVFESVSGDVVLAGTICVALERNFKIRNANIQATKKYFIVTLSIAAMFSVAGATTYLTSDLNATGHPTYHPQSEIWTILLGLKAAISAISTIWLYTSTYYYAKRKLLQLPPEKEVARIKAQRKVMMYCALMASTLLVCLLPAAILASMYHSEIIENTLWMRETTEVMLALDGILNPMLVIFFMPNIRRSLLSLGRNASSVRLPFEVECDDRTTDGCDFEVGRESNEATIANSSPQGFMVLRVQEGG